MHDVLSQSGAFTPRFPKGRPLRFNGAILPSIQYGSSFRDGRRSSEAAGYGNPSPNLVSCGPLFLFSYCRMLPSDGISSLLRRLRLFLPVSHCRPSLPTLRGLDYAAPDLFFKRSAVPHRYLGFKGVKCFYAVPHRGYVTLFLGGNFSRISLAEDRSRASPARRE